MIAFVIIDSSCKKRIGLYISESHRGASSTIYGFCEYIISKNSLFNCVLVALYHPWSLYSNGFNLLAPRYSQSSSLSYRYKICNSAQQNKIFWSVYRLFVLESTIRRKVQAFRLSFPTILSHKFSLRYNISPVSQTSSFCTALKVILLELLS